MLNIFKFCGVISSFFNIKKNYVIIFFNFFKNKKTFNKIIFFKKYSRINLSINLVSILFKVLKDIDFICKTSKGYFLIKNLFFNKLVGSPIFLII